MIQQLRNLPLPLRILAVGAALIVALALAAGVGAIAALVLEPGLDSSGRDKPGQAEGAARREQAREQEDPSDQSSEDEYLNEVGNIQNGAVKASLESNTKLLRYDLLTGDDLKEMEANRSALRAYSERVEGLDPPERYEDQYRVFVLAIDELRNANELAYALGADPASATQARFEAYDRHISKATSHLRRSNEILGRDYKTTEVAQEVSFG